MENHSVFVQGAPSLEWLATQLGDLALDFGPSGEGLIDSDGTSGIYDSSLTGDQLDDIPELTLSQFRFEVWARTFDGAQWVRKAFDRLSANPKVTVAWLIDTQRIVAVSHARSVA
ncbi:hypothetical protein AADG42_07400 [Ammonicoccus fulvus]|uniref:Uncharacterized protein n=1 Tax=Ammonicoccus fulvus TaxID=3138240 RepID=A0ABZ3FM41_9ACTN